MLTTPLVLLANERPLINIDVTLLMDVGLWLALYFFLKATFWNPVLAVIHGREAGTEGLRAEARTLETDAKRVRDQFDTSLRKARETAAVDREKIRAEGAKREGELLAQVRTEVNAALETQRVALGVQRDALRKELLAVVPALSTDITARLLRREVRS